MAIVNSPQTKNPLKTRLLGYGVDPVTRVKSRTVLTEVNFLSWVLLDIGKEMNRVSTLSAQEFL